MILSNSKIEWDVIIVSEINIKKYESVMYKIPNYDNFFVTRENTKRGGGIGMFVKKNIIVEFESIKCDINDGIMAMLRINDIEVKIVSI